MPAMLIECCFVDNEIDYKAYNAEIIATAIKVQWVQDKTGWWYKHLDGTYTVKDWEKINNKWYFFDENRLDLLERQ